MFSWGTLHSRARTCVRACLRACVRACVRVCVCVHKLSYAVIDLFLAITVICLNTFFCVYVLRSIKIRLISIVVIYMLH